jgi:hypothetical protein
MIVVLGRGSNTFGPDDVGEIAEWRSELVR